jgi:hypothetical protein
MSEAPVDFAQLLSTMKMPTAEELSAMTEKRLANQRDHFAYVETTPHFTPVDLGDWIALCEKADVPFIPATAIATAPTHDLILSVDGDEYGVSEDVIQFWKAVQAFQEANPTGYMLRWSCCSMSNIKYELSRGNAAWEPDCMQLYVDDFRAYDIISDHPKGSLSAFARPWVKIDQQDGYPVEYRAFVGGVVPEGEIAVSSYYPQRPLPETEEFQADMERVIELTQKLIAAQTLPINSPQTAAIADLTKNHFTADFARVNGEILFLEGGPAHYPRWGAHPCCFAGREIRGYAFASVVPPEQL